MAALLSALLLSLCVLVLGKGPNFPQQYYVKGVFSIPYFNISEPIEMWYDAVNNQQVISYYNGMDVTIIIQNTTYSIFPEIDTLTCQKSVGYFGPLISLFPNLSDYTLLNGTKEVNNILVRQYQLAFSNWSASAVYDMYISTTGVPVQLYLDGVDYLFDSHPDIYIMDYGLYLPDYTDKNAFEVPTICKNAKEVSAAPIRGNAGKVFAALAEAPKSKPDSILEIEFQQFVQKYNKNYATKDEYDHRFAIFKDTVQFIRTHNSNPAKSHQVALNHFADMTHEEFRQQITPKVKRPANNGAPLVHQPSGVELPTTVDWRTQGAVTPVKDQGVCGSCYAFGSVGSLEGAYKIATGKLISLSEQQLVDCAWNDDLGVQGCNGGFASVVFQWIMDNNGIATEASYPYLMQDGFCRAKDQSSGVHVKAYVNVTEGENNLLDAVALMPVAVAIDASHPEFRYYTSGVYYQADCGNTLDDLDHEVLAIGYGTYQGQDYWLVKNSWSTHWGDAGYVMMSRNKGNNCGIATQPNYAIVA